MRASSVLEKLVKDYAGKVRVVYKNFVVHPQVVAEAHLGSCAAGKQGKFLQMDELLWDKGFKERAFDKDATAEAGGQAQKCWESSAGCPIVIGFAQQIGLNVDKFKADMKGECQALIQKDQRDLQALAVSATPSFFVNGRFLAGAMPMDNFVALVDEELKKANEKIQAGTPAASYYQQVVLDKGLKTVERPAQ
jgi:protein-disulfide isomerase